MIRKYPWRGWQIALADALIVWLSFAIAYYLRYELEFLRPVDEINTASFSPYIPYTLIFMISVLLAYTSGKLYEDRRERTLVDEAFRIVNGVSNATVLVMALSFLLRPLVFSRLMLVQAAIIYILLLILLRGLLRIYRTSLHKRGIGVEKVLLIGAGEVGRHVMRAIVARPDLGYWLVGFVDDKAERQKNLGRVAALGGTEDIETIINREDVDLVIISLPWQSQRKILDIIERCQRQNIAVRTVPDLFQLNMTQIQVEMLGGVPLLGVKQDIQLEPALLIAKRMIDVALTLLILPILLPIMLLTALAIRLDTPGPVLFYQERAGFKGRPFQMVKFRSMIDGAEEQHDELRQPNEDDPEGSKGNGKTDDPRITRVGHFIRRTSIDELPQLINVLRGDMSLVGPRPALRKEVELYKPWHRQRLMVRPGMTGLWQVSGRSDIPFEEKVLLDIYYIENWSLALDLQILAQTAPQVLFGRGAY